MAAAIAVLGTCVFLAHAVAAAASPPLPGCVMPTYENTGCTRNPYSTHRSPDAGACCATCQRDPECQAWTFRPPGDAGSGSAGACLFSLGSGVVFENVSGATCGTDMPPPSPGPPAPAQRDFEAFDCGMRRLALEYGMAILSGDHAASLAEALQFGGNCSSDGVLQGASSGVQAVASGTLGGAASTFWVDPLHGDDDAPGTTKHRAWRTLPRAAAELARTQASARAATTVYLAQGTHTLQQTLELGAAHSGASEQAPVTWLADPAAPPGSVVISGAALIERPKWEPRGSGVWSAVLSPAPTWPVESFFADGVRQIRARWPNGDPATYCARDLHGGKCAGFAQQSSTRVTGDAPRGRAVGRPNVKIYARESGELIAEGVMRPLNQTHEFNVSVPTKAWHKRKATFSTFEAYEGGALDRFDTSLTKAYWNTQTPLEMHYNKSGFTEKEWKRPEVAVLHTYQSAYWGSWAFRVSSVNRDAGLMTFSEGGFQEARGGTMGGVGQRGLTQDYYVENVFEELDAPREWYYDNETSTLFWAPADGEAPTGNEELRLPRMETVLALRGRGQHAPVRHIHFVGVTFAHAAPSFLLPHEPTTGGDWAVRRSAAVVVEHAEGIRLEGCTVRNAEGNGVFFSQYVRDSALTRSEVVGVGGTPVLLLGAAELMDGRAGNYPFRNEVSHNYLHHFGVWNRQGAGYFEGIARRNNVSFNVVHDGPRAGANFNDGFGGGLLFEGNLIFNVVQDTGEHGSTNSWDRAPMIWLDDNGEVATAPETRRISRNFIFRNSFRGPTSNKWALDKDDGSSNYLEEGNVLVYGAVKDRDGLQRDVVGNLFLYPDKMPFEDTTRTQTAMSFEVNEFQWDSFINNTVVSSVGAIYSCTNPFTRAPSPLGTARMQGNTFLTPNETSTPFSGGRCAEGSTDFGKWQALGYDAGSTQSGANLSAAQAVAKARQWLALPSNSSARGVAAPTLFMVAV